VALEVIEKEGGRASKKRGKKKGRTHTYHLAETTLTDTRR